MKKLLFLLTAAIAAMSLCAAPVDQAAAAKVAKKYLAETMYAGKIMAPAALNPILLKAEAGDSKLNNPVYYIFNTSTTFLVVSGDDRAEDILMVGDEPLNMDRIPDGLQYLLDCYKEQLTFLMERPNLQVEKRSQTPMLRAVTYGPLLTAKWDQETPYNNLCKFTYNNRTYTCLTGCPATSAAMVMYYWKYPASVSAIASYTSTLDIGYNQSVDFTYPGLDATTFDWGNMKDTYSSYNSAQASAVATLMRYIGQAEQMMYGTSAAGGSGIYTNETYKVVNMFKNWGYQNTVAVKYKSSYTSTNWANLIIGEMAAGRPVIYNGVDNSSGGHAFNVDGYRDSDGKYHVNFGWSGDGNSWYAMDAFTYSGYTFNQGQQAVIGIQSPGGTVTTPELTVNPTSLAFTGEVGETYTKTFTVSGENLYGEVTISKSGSSYFTVSPTTLTAAQANAGAQITVTYKPTSTGNQTGTITVSSSGADNQTISLTGTSAKTPTLTVEPASLSLNTTVGTVATKTFVVSGTNLTDNVSLRVEGDDSPEFSVDKISILRSVIGNGVTVTVSYDPYEAGTHHAYVSITSSGAETKTVTLTGTAQEPDRLITVEPASLSFETVTGQAVSQTFYLTGTNLSGDLTLSLTDPKGSYSLSTTSVTAARAARGINITVTFNPSTTGTHNATVNISGGGAQAKTVTLSGTVAGPTVTVNPTSLTFAANTGETVTQTFTVTGANLTGNLSLALNDANGVYSINPTSITAANAANGFPVTVTYAPTAFGNHQATVTINGGGAASVSVNLNGTATLAKFTPVMLAAVEEYINLTQFRADWTDATPEANVASYTLEVTPKPEEPAEPVLLHSLSGSAYSGNTYNDIVLSAPWSGVNVRGGNNIIYIKNNYNNIAQGYIKYTIPEGYSNATFTLMITSMNDATDGIGDVTVSTPQTAAVSHNFVKNETFYWVVTASSGEEITIYSTDAKYSPSMTLLAVYAGDATPATLMATETGDATWRTITGITDKFYTVENLTAEGTFFYRVKALYQDGTESDWSNIEEVTLFQNGHGYEPGDVDHDGTIGVVDVTTLIDLVLNGNDNACPICADVDQDGEVSVTDVTALIDMVLNGSAASLMMPVTARLEK
ncbi:MAG: C10 family peptidase [Muribaculaceae bacterium]|nr:C10 family peptidase [Muribaculaceae bacterium]